MPEISDTANTFRSQLENSIYEAVDKFERETGLTVVDITVERRHLIGHERLPPDISTTVILSR